MIRPSALLPHACLPTAGSQISASLRTARSWQARQQNRSPVCRHWYPTQPAHGRAAPFSPALTCRGTQVTLQRIAAIGSAAALTTALAHSVGCLSVSPGQHFVYR